MAKMNIKCVDDLYDIGNSRIGIEQYVSQAEDALNCDVSRITYMPAREPMKYVFEEYIKVGKYILSMLGTFIREQMDAIHNCIIKQIVLSKEQLNTISIVADKSKKAKALSNEVLNKIKAILAIANIEGVNISDNYFLHYPMEIEKYVTTHSNTLDLYAPSTGIRSGFEQLNGHLKTIGDCFEKLINEVAKFKELQGRITLDMVLSSYAAVSINLDRYVPTKKNNETQLYETIKKADGLMKELRAKIATEMEKRTVPITTAFSRIDPKSVPDIQSTDVFAIKFEGNSLIQQKISFDEMSRRLYDKAVATVALSTVCAVQNDKDKDCKGQMNLSVLKKLHVVSSDAEALFIVDDGYYEVQLPMWMYVDASDFNKEDEIYISNRAYYMLQTISPELWGKR